MRSNRNLPGKPRKDNAKRGKYLAESRRGPRGKREISFIPTLRLAHSYRTYGVCANCYFKVSKRFSSELLRYVCNDSSGLSPAREGSSGRVRVTLSPVVVTKEKFSLARSSMISQYFRYDVTTFGKYFDTESNDLIVAPREAVTRDRIYA